ncbi:MAG: hypothetical protein DRP74_07125 [Candidatus Omnitrophota bacterium]|nr:MAG: hypothetical protein DRP74_07125 [Candidatus Omnitrophota bacterium]
MKSLKQFFSLFLRIAVSLALLFFLLRQVGIENLISILKSANLPLLALAFLLNFLNFVFCLFRWEMLLKTTKIHLSLKRVIMAFAGGVFFNMFLPTSIGGDLVRSIDLATHTKKPREIVATVLLDRLSGYIGLVLVAIMAVLLGYRIIGREEKMSILISVGILATVLIVALLAIFNRFVYTKINTLLHSPKAGRIREAIKNLHQEMHIFRHHTGTAFKNLLFSITIQLIQPIVFLLIASSLGIKINVLYFFIFIPIITAITFLPISIGGLGLRDLSSVLYFTKVGVSKDLAFSMSLMASSFLLIYGVIGGIIYVLTIHHRRKQYNKPRAVPPLE